MEGASVRFGGEIEGLQLEVVRKTITAARRGSASTLDEGVDNWIAEDCSRIESEDCEGDD